MKFLNENNKDVNIINEDVNIINEDVNIINECVNIINEDMKYRKGINNFKLIEQIEDIIFIIKKMKDNKSNVLDIKILNRRMNYIKSLENGNKILKHIFMIII
jgi:hypothetical protein